MNIYDELHSSQAVLIDVRTTNEWNVSHVKGAEHFELSKLQNGETPDLEKDTKIYTYCRSGNRSQLANMLLMRMGFYNVENLGGINDVLGLSNKFEIEQN